MPPKAARGALVDGSLGVLAEAGVGAVVVGVAMMCLKRVIVLREETPTRDRDKGQGTRQKGKREKGKGYRRERARKGR
jgi:hypothetical protein